MKTLLTALLCLFVLPAFAVGERCTYDIYKIGWDPLRYKLSPEWSGPYFKDAAGTLGLDVVDDLDSCAEAVGRQFCGEHIDIYYRQLKPMSERCEDVAHNDVAPQWIKCREEYNYRFDKARIYQIYVKYGSSLPVIGKKPIGTTVTCPKV